MKRNIGVDQNLLYNYIDITNHYTIYIYIYTVQYIYIHIHFPLPPNPVFPRDQIRMICRNLTLWTSSELQTRSRKKRQSWHHQHVILAVNLGSNRTLTFQHVYYIYLKKYLNIQKYERLSIYYILKYILKVSTCPRRWVAMAENWVQHGRRQGKRYHESMEFSQQEWW